MGKRKIWFCTAALAVALAVAPAGCGKEKPETKKETKTAEKTKAGEAEEKENQMEAVYIKNDSGSMFVDLVTESPFFGTIPKDGLFDENGEAISKEELKNGAVLLVEGNGVMAQSYPAQYHGITRLQVKEQENTGYAEKYQGYLEQFLVKEEPGKIPYLDITYSQTQAIVTAAIGTTGTYQWTYTDEEGEEITTSAGSAPVLQWEKLTEIKLTDTVETELLFSRKPEQVTITRWENEKKMEPQSQEAVTEGEAVAQEENQEGNPVFTAEPGFIYLVKAVFDKGEAEYGFYTVQAQ